MCTGVTSPYWTTALFYYSTIKAECQNEFLVGETLPGNKNVSGV